MKSGVERESMEVCVRKACGKSCCNAVCGVLLKERMGTGGKKRRYVRVRSGSGSREEV